MQIVRQGEATLYWFLLIHYISPQTKTACIDCMQAVSLWFGAGLQHGQGGIVVGLLADFRHEFGMQHFVVFIQNHHGTGG